MLAVSGVGVLFLAGLNWRYFAPVPWALWRLFRWCGNACSIIRKNACLFSLIRSATLWVRVITLSSRKSALDRAACSAKGLARAPKAGSTFCRKNTPISCLPFMPKKWALSAAYYCGAVRAVAGAIGLHANQMRSQFARLVVGGIGFSLFVYIFINLAMVMGLAPVVGVPLPFISYGGTSMLTFLLSIGVVLSLERQVRVEMSRG